MSSDRNSIEPKVQTEGRSSPYLSTSGIRGHKRPRNPRKHLATCNNLSTTAPIIHCECPPFDPGQHHTTGMYVNGNRVK